MKPSEIVEALTADEARDVLLRMLNAVAGLDAGGGKAAFVGDMRLALSAAERYARGESTVRQRIG